MGCARPRLGDTEPEHEPIAKSRAMVEGQLNVLPRDYRLHWYRIERVLGQGGFGVTYLARDTNLDQLVAIKEYLPVEFAGRASDNAVQPRTEDHRERYQWGLERFISEAQTLAKFDHPSIVRVHSVFEHNNTAYMVMRYERGENLQSILNHCKTLEEDQLMDILLPILDGLAEIHRTGFIHRDIKPDNIYIRKDGTPVLLDFGSARHAMGNTRTITILVAPGYAPFEQYSSNSDQQGPWTDIYSLGATLYRAVTGTPPIDAMSRSKGILGSTRDVLVPATEFGRGRYSQSFLESIDHALEFNEKDRPQTIAEWKTELGPRNKLAVAAERTGIAAESGSPGSAAPPRAEARKEALVAESRRTASARLSGTDSPAGPPRPTERLGRPQPAPPSRWLRAGIAVAFFVLLSLLGIFVWRNVGEQPGPRPVLSQEQTADKQRLEKLEQDLGALERKLEEERRRLDEERKRIEEQRDTEASVAAREKKLHEDQRRLEEERQRVAEQKRKAEEERRRVEAAERRAAEEARRIAEAARKRKEEISRLLVAAQTDFAADRLSTPAGANALERFRKVLELEPENTKAQQGIERVVERYVGFADQARARREFAKAEGFLNQAAAIRPDANKVASARARVAAEKAAFEQAQQSLAAERKEAEEAASVAAVTPAGSTTSPPGLEERLARAIAAFDERNYPEAFRKLKPLAEQDVPEASYRVGIMYDTGKGVPRSDAEAVKWYRKAAEQGYSPAQNSLGVMYGTGRGVSRNDGEALKWYHRAAEQCNADAQVNLGRMYAQGRGVTRSDFQAYAWYNVAAEAGDEIAKEHRDAIARKLQSVELGHARKLSQRYARDCENT